MSHQFEPSYDEAVARCAKAWKHTYDLASIDPKHNNLDRESSDTFARTQAAISFREVMPTLAGYNNIRDFIACTAYAMLHKILYDWECQNLLSAAKVALAALRAQPKPEKISEKRTISSANSAHPNSSPNEIKHLTSN